MFLFTDNTVAESAFYRGTSASPKLFDLVLRLRKLEMASQFKLHLLHVPGTRMIEQGTDGLSRGNLTEGVMTGKAMRWFVPLDLSVLDRVPKVLDWVRSWTQEPSLQPLEPEEWFIKGQDMVGGAKNSEGVWVARLEADKTQCISSWFHVCVLTPGENGFYERQILCVKFLLESLGHGKRPNMNL